MANEQPRAGFVGLGAMGRSMAQNLSEAGLLHGVWNRTAAPAEQFCREHDCRMFQTVAALAGECDVVVLCVSADADVQAVVDAMLPGLTAGTLIIDCSTVARQTAQTAARVLAAQGCGFLDAPVSGGTEGARQGTLTIMVGGSEADFAQGLPVLSAMGQRIQHMGEVGAGQATKAVNQVLCAGINQAVCEALHFAEALDLPVDEVVDVVGSGAAGNWFINHRGKTMVLDRFDPGFRMALHYKDLKICEAMAKEAGVAVPLSVQTRKEYEQLMPEGYADSDISALYKLPKAG